MSGVTRVLGVDIGGTSSRARLTVGGSIAAEATAPSANASAVGLDSAAQALEELLGQLPLAQYAPLDAACVGAAGVIGAEAPSGARQLFTERLAPLARPGRVAVLPDVYLVLPAAGLDRGVALICGTGSAALGTDGTRSVTAGGWGYLLGDEASGYWAVRQALRVLLRRADRGQPLGGLGPALLGSAGVTSLDELREQFYHDPRSGRWAALAPVVLTSPDPAAGAILEEAAKALDELVGAVEERLGGHASLPVVLAGGLSAERHFCDVITGYLRRSRPGSVVGVLSEPPVAGAVRLAERAAAGAGWPAR